MPAPTERFLSAPTERFLTALCESLSTVLHEYEMLPCDLAVVTLANVDQAIQLRAVPGGDDSMIWEVSAGPIAKVLGADGEGLL